MQKTGSYDVGTFATNTQAEIDRLIAQVDLFWLTEFNALIRFGLVDGMDFLDFGCGPGRLVELLKSNFPNLKCAGIDIDKTLVDEAKVRATKANLHDCVFTCGDFESPGYPPESFDFIVIRLVLEHAIDPEAALKSVIDLLRPGGRMVVISNDFDYHLHTSPTVPELDELYRAYRASRKNDGGNPCIGRSVPNLLIKSGLKLVTCEVELAHNAMLGDRPFLKAEGAGIPAKLVKMGFLEPEALAKLTESWREMLMTPDHSIARLLWLTVGEKSKDENAFRQSAEQKNENRGQGFSNGENLSAAQTALTSETNSNKISGAAEERLQKGAPKMEEPNKAKSAANETLETSLPEYLLSVFRKFLENNALSVEDSMAAIGVDSISAMSIQEMIEAERKVIIPIDAFFDDTPIRDLSRFFGSIEPSEPIKSEHPEKGERPSEMYEEGEI